MRQPPPLAAKIAIALGFVLGTWLFVDGVHRLITGDFVRIHGKLGPWADLVRWLGGNPMQFAPVLIVLGAAWLVAANVYLFQNSPASWRGMLLMVIFSSWYAGLASLALVVQLCLLLWPSTRAALGPAERGAA
ncbi:MAG TPA: hypothetical protein VE996_00550 [Terriglobales bacterium]|nr:hypothetical protein [Terriglobales bacterium]